MIQTKLYEKNMTKNYNCMTKYILHNMFNIVTSINMYKKQGGHNEDATNAITKAVLERTFSFNNICDEINLGS